MKALPSCTSSLTQDAIALLVARERPGSREMLTSLVRKTDFENRRLVVVPRDLGDRPGLHRLRPL